MSKKKADRRPQTADGSMCPFCGTVNQKSPTATLHGQVQIGNETVRKYVQRCTGCGKPVFLIERTRNRKN